MSQQKHALYLSFDIEADGPCPAINSILSLAFCGFILENNNTSYLKVFEWKSNLKPMTGCVSDPNMNCLNKETQRDPLEAFKELHEAIITLQQTYKIITGAWHAAYDWQWINYYFHKLIGSNPLGVSAECISTLNTRNLENRFECTKHDAHEQGIIWMNMLIRMLKSSDLSITIDNAFLRMCYIGDLSGIQQYVEKDKGDPNVKDTLGRTGIFYAIGGNRPEILKYLIQVAPGIQNILTNDSTSAFQRVMVENSELIKIMLTPIPSSSPGYESITKRTYELLTKSLNELLSPEEMAKSRSDRDSSFIELIKEFKILQSIPDDFLRMCFKGDMYGIQKYVYIDEKDPYITDKLGRSGLIYAIWGNQTDVANFLMHNAPGIHLILTTNKTSAFQIATIAGDPAMVKMLLLPLPTSFPDYKKITKQTLKLLSGSCNDLFSPEVMAKSMSDDTIYCLIKHFKYTYKDIDEEII